MLLELILLGIVAYLLLHWHRREIERGGDGLGAAGPILEELEGVILKIAEIFKKQSNAVAKKAAKSASNSSVDVASTQKNSTSSPRVEQLEKFESVRQPKEPNSRSKHHSKHRSKMDSALKAAAQK